MFNFKDDVNLVLCGEAGQGIKTIEAVLIHVFKEAGYHVFSSREYMSRIRGGSNSTQIRVAASPIHSQLERIDMAVLLDQTSWEHLQNRIGSNTLVLAGKGLAPDSAKAHEIDFLGMAKEAGSEIYANIVASAVIYALFDAKKAVFEEYLHKKFKSKGVDIIQANLKAFQMGLSKGQGLKTEKEISVNLKADKSLQENIFLNGSQAIGFGALYGGCNFICSYPMSPSTAVLTFLSRHAKEMEIAVEQAEDEISAVNMAVGADYAGARAMITTSGGGFALMGEGISLAGIMENGIVMHLAQRPGPATGLPTRTEQGDLELALYSGHGEFPRIVLAPSTHQEGISLTAKAFNWAGKFQVPVIILTDQYFLDSSVDIPAYQHQDKIEEHIIESQSDYKRYALTEDGISPQAIPGFGKGLVCADSDEHDEGGRITESMDVRNAMVQKRLKKLQTITSQVPKPLWEGPQDSEIVIISWGSTYPAVSEAVSKTGGNLAHLHYSFLYPLYPKTAELLSSAKKIITIEMNSTGQFAKVLKLYADIKADHQILKYDGIQFYADEIEARLKEIL